MHCQKYQILYSVSQKVAHPLKLFCNIFTQVKYSSVKFCYYVASLYLHIFTSFGRFIITMVIFSYTASPGEKIPQKRFRGTFFDSHCTM